eukprot:scaffold6_cov330-Pavlova_lutheri.AAC.8
MCDVEHWRRTGQTRSPRYRCEPTKDIEQGTPPIDVSEKEVSMGAVPYPGKLGQGRWTRPGHRVPWRYKGITSIEWEGTWNKPSMNTNA